MLKVFKRRERIVEGDKGCSSESAERISRKLNRASCESGERVGEGLENKLQEERSLPGRSVESADRLVPRYFENGKLSAPTGNETRRFETGREYRCLLCCKERSD